MLSSDTRDVRYERSKTCCGTILFLSQVIRNRQKREKENNTWQHLWQLLGQGEHAPPALPLWKKRRSFSCYAEDRAAVQCVGRQVFILLVEASGVV